MRRTITGLNWSVAINDPFRVLGPGDESLGEILTRQWAGPNEPIVFVLHVVCPRIEYLDRGKSNVALPALPRETVIKLVLDVTKRWTRHRPYGTDSEAHELQKEETKMANALKLEKFPGLTKVAAPNIESRATESALKDAAFAHEIQLLDLKNEFVHREAKLREEYLNRVNQITSEAAE